MDLKIWIQRNLAVSKLRDAIIAKLSADSDALRRASLSAFIREMSENPDTDPELWIQRFEREFHLTARAKQQLAADLARGQELIANARLSLFEQIGAIARTVDPTVLQAAYTVHFPRLENDVRINVLRQLRRLVAEGGDVDLMAKTLRQGRMVSYQAKTLSNTALAQFNNAYSRELAQEAGIDKYRYIGPPAQRAFCVRLLASGRDWTEEEIRIMDNGQGLEVMTSCGGYNCQHMWIPVPDEVPN